MFCLVSFPTTLAGRDVVVLSLSVCKQAEGRQGGLSPAPWGTHKCRRGYVHGPSFPGTLGSGSEQDQQLLQKRKVVLRQGVMENQESLSLHAQGPQAALSLPQKPEAAPGPVCGQDEAPVPFLAFPPSQIWEPGNGVGGGVTQRCWAGVGRSPEQVAVKGRETSQGGLGEPQEDTCFMILSPFLTSFPHGCLL